MRRFLKTAYWLVLSLIITCSVVSMVIVINHDLSEEIGTLDQLNKVIAEEGYKLGISNTIKIDIEFDERSTKYLDEIQAEAETRSFKTDETYFVIFFRQPVKRSTVKHELSHVHTNLTLDWFGRHGKERLFSEIFAYFYAVTNVDLIPLVAQLKS